jgi:hypothetical protein
MRTVFAISTIAPIVKSNGVFSNKSIAFDIIQTLAGNNVIIVSEESDQYAKFYNKQINYINFTKYFKDTKNGAKIVLKIMNPDSTVDTPLIKTIECTMYIVNQKL